MKSELVVFLDRDGVICEDRDYLLNQSLTLIPNSAEAIGDLNSEGYRVIVIINQAAIARGKTSLEKDSKENDFLKRMLREKNAYIDHFYVCPHHPTQGVIKEYSFDCDCRKPKPGMILEAQKYFQIELLDQCFMIGNKTTNIKAGKSAGCKTILLRTGYAGKDELVKVYLDYTENTLYDAVKFVILKK